ncbi:MAG: phospholipase D-like domain-containing protein, partial [Chromatiales bacterium]|nr:phospholipase D-like domain-containing protein [Chromatiales bacterium]
KKRLKDRWNRARNTPYFQDINIKKFTQQLQQNILPFISAPAKLFYDLPEKITHTGQSSDIPFGAHIRPIINDATSEIIIVSPYFIPGDDGVNWLSKCANNHVSIKILTNSLATTDVIAVHAGYQRYRPALLVSGIKLFELKPDAHTRFAKARNFLKGLQRVSLHAKYIVVDKRWVYTGSANLDPRSRRLNTEIGVLIDSPELAQSIISLFEQTTQIENSYKLFLRDDLLLWSSCEDGKKVEYSHDPKARIWKRIVVRLMALLPAENLL